jgi:hypothetical protein
MWALRIATKETEFFDTHEEAMQRLLEHAKEYVFSPEYEYLTTGMDRDTILESAGFRYTLIEVAVSADAGIEVRIPDYDGDTAVMSLTPPQALRLAGHLINLVACTPPLQAHQAEMRSTALRAAAKTCAIWGKL